AYDTRTALLVVDVQHDFADVVGSLYVRGAEEIVPLVNDEVASAVDAGALVVYSQDWHPESTPHFEKDGGIWPVHCVRNTWGAEFHSELRVVEDAPVIRRVVICGLTTDYCVVESVSDARARHLDVDVLTSAIRAVDLRSGDGQ